MSTVKEACENENKSPYTPDEVSRFEKYHDVIIPLELRDYLLNVSKELQVKNFKPFLVDLRLCGNKFIENTQLSNKNIEDGVWFDDFCNLEGGDVLDGTLQISEETYVVIKGSGYGFTLVESDDCNSTVRIYKLSYFMREYVLNQRLC